MESMQNTMAIKIIAAISYLVMVVVNWLAASLPINGVTPGEVSDSYPNLFAPAGLTFAIWGLIYLLLAIFIVYQLGNSHGNTNPAKAELLRNIGVLFSISSLANSAWIFSWHYRIIPLSMLLMAVLLICLIMINQRLAKEKLRASEKFFIRLPFSLYFGWITVATIANATVLLVSLNWNGFGISEPIWAAIMISIGMIIGITVILRNKDTAYGFVLIWAYAGILIKHTSLDGFSSQYPVVINTVIVCLVVIGIAEIKNILSIRKKRTL